MIRTGLDALLEEVGELAGRRYAIAAHAAAVSADLLPVHLALLRRGAEPPALLLAPEHGFYGIEQDMVGSSDRLDPVSGTPIESLYDGSEESLKPRASVFADLDLVLIDFQDVGSRYYTYAATALWTAEAALEAECEVWVLDRPNPLGGVEVEGKLPRPELASFVGAFAVPVRHGMTLAELLLWGLGEKGANRAALRIWPLQGWARSMSWAATGRYWLAPSPNVPTPTTAQVYPGGCLIEATNLSEGRGTTRPFELIGSPGIEPVALAERLAAARLPGARFVPVYFRPGFQKHAGAVCGGVQWIVEDAEALRPLRCGVEILSAVRELDPGFAWRREPYEFVSEIPAIDLLTGSEELRTALEDGEELESWLGSWMADEQAFRDARRDVLLYPEQAGRGS